MSCLNRPIASGLARTYKRGKRTLCSEQGGEGGRGARWGVIGEGAGGRGAPNCEPKVHPTITETDIMLVSQRRIRFVTCRARSSQLLARLLEIFFFFFFSSLSFLIDSPPALSNRSDLTYINKTSSKSFFFFWYTHLCISSFRYKSHVRLFIFSSSCTYIFLIELQFYSPVMRFLFCTYRESRAR